ncbi:MAG: hypothetical protein JSS46_02150, partial [Proteobacteria bacterium]|nr:hypothetical protein [Pseudomonadota bacterium]
MSIWTLVVLVLATCAAGAAVGWFVPERRCPLVVAWAGSLAALALLVASVEVLVSGAPAQVALWTVRPLGVLMLALDPLAAFFLLVSAVVFVATSVFSAGYLGHYLGRYSLRAFATWYLLLFASIVLVIVAADAFTFLLAWEAMSIVSYLLADFDHRRAGTSRAAFIMLAMGEAGFMAVTVACVFVGVHAGSLMFTDFRTASAALGPLARWLVFLLTFFGFGVKAGLVPVNTWLPRAHPAAPANVSAVLSAVILNLGLYGILRFDGDLVHIDAVGPGVVVLIIGAVSALVGILYATTENDLKAMLAHSSIENMGIVTAGLGAGWIFAAGGHAAAAAIAFVAAFYHVANHSAYKALLFLGAGVVDVRAGTRDLNRLGGLVRVLPWTSAAFLVGALGIAALPPFNGFVSEWLTLQTMLRSAELGVTWVKVVFALCGAILALTAALAVTCFVKAFAMGFLGMSRSPAAAAAHEPGRSGLVPLAFLALVCVLLGALPTYVVPALDSVTSAYAGASATDALVPPFFGTAAGHARLPASFAAEFRDLGAQLGGGIAPGRGLIVLHRGGEPNPVVFAMSTSYMVTVLIALLVAT